MRNLLTLIAVCFSSFAFTQTYTEDVDFIQSIYGKEKKMIVADFIKLDEGKKDAFWKLYDEYETKRKELGKRRIALLERYVNNYEKLDDANTSQIINEISELSAKTDKLVASYHKKIENVAGAKAAAQFFQLEVYFLSAIRLSILENIPFIGELK